MSPLVIRLWRVVDALFAPRRAGYRDPVFGWIPFRRPDLPVPLDGPRNKPANPFNRNQEERENHV